MRKITEGQFALGGLAILSVWLFVALPLLPCASADAAMTVQDADGTEFWPTLFGYRLKITDTLLVVFAGGLFWATWLLFGATKKLVQSAEQTARRQLRAYVFAEPQALQQGNGVWTCRVHIKNSGQTPAELSRKLGDDGVR